jgi:hypothetical protein
VSCGIGSEETKVKRIAIGCIVLGLAMAATVMAQRQTFQKFTIEGQPVDRRSPELDTDHPVFPGQTRAPYYSGDGSLAAPADVPRDREIRVAASLARERQPKCRHLFGWERAAVPYKHGGSTVPVRVPSARTRDSERPA